MQRKAWIGALALAAGLAIGCGGGGTGPARIPSSYRVVDVTPGGGAVDPAALPRITSSGAVVGGFRANVASDFEAFVWTAGGGLDGLGTLGGATSVAAGGNQGGLIVGASDTAAGTRRGFVASGGALTNLGGFGPGLASAAFDVNSANIIVGSAVDSSGNVRPVQFGGPGFPPIDLGSLGGPNGVARAVNDGGQIVGYAEAGGGARRAFLTAAGSLFDLGSLGGASAEAFDVNNAGQVVGWAETSGGQRLPFVFTLGSMRALELPAGATGGAGLSINLEGVIVGEAVVGGNPTGVVWYPARAPRLLNGFVTLPAGFQVLRGTSVDDEGRILAVIGNSGGETRIVRLDPSFATAP